MKDYTIALDEIREKLRPLHEQACKARDEAQTTASSILKLLRELDELHLAYLKERQKGEPK